MYICVHTAMDIHSVYVYMCACMCMFVCVHVCVYVCVHVSVCVSLCVVCLYVCRSTRAMPACGDQRTEIFLDCSPPLLLRQGPFSVTEAHHLAGLLSQQLLGSACLCYPHLGLEHLLPCTLYIGSRNLNFGSHD